jgi:hypothetical protein
VYVAWVLVAKVEWFVYIILLLSPFSCICYQLFKLAGDKEDYIFSLSKTQRTTFHFIIFRTLK